MEKIIMLIIRETITDTGKHKEIEMRDKKEKQNEEKNTKK